MVNTQSRIENLAENALSVDLEEYYHAANLTPYLKNDPISRLEYSTKLTLDTLAVNNTKVTFFILAELASKSASLLKEIASVGHEIAAHSYTHRLIYDLSESEFYQEAKLAKDTLEDITGKKVLGFRAPNFSITSKTPWAQPILAELGYLYDSSVYPIYHPRYSNMAASTKVETIQTAKGDILQVPLATYPIKIFSKKINLPIAGGAYWRLFPNFLMKKAIATLNKKNIPCFCYFHPWELDPNQPQLVPKYKLTYWRHYGNLANFSKFLVNFTSKFSFNTYAKVLNIDDNAD